MKYCAECGSVNNGPRIDKGGQPLKSIRIPRKPFTKVGIDLIQLKACKGFHYVVTMVDYTTKWVEAAPLRTKHAELVAKFMYGVICRFGAMEICISDQGREFVNETIALFNALVGVEQRVSTAYHPQTNGLVEKQNSTTESCIQKYCEESKNWVDALQGILYSVRVAVHASTGFSPYRLLYGRDPITPWQMADDDADGNPLPPSQAGEPMGVGESIQHMDELRARTLGQARINNRLAQKVQARYYNDRHLHTPLDVGDRIWWKNVKEAARLEKGKAKWRGPYKIVEILENGNYRVLNQWSHEIRQQCPPKQAKRFYGLDDLEAMDAEEEQAELSRVQEIEKQFMDKEKDIDDMDAREEARSQEEIGMYFKGLLI